MLRELRDVRQEAGQSRRRWFATDDLDLVVWVDEQDRPTGFQLCYDKRSDEHALTWFPEHGFSHARVSSGEESPLANRTPVLVTDGHLPIDRLRDAFRRASSDIDPAVQSFVLDRLDSLTG